jgi:hypothetical protein
VITRVFSVVLFILGAAVIVRTFAEGVGGGVGLLLGALLMLAGSLRLYLSRR